MPWGLRMLFLGPSESWPITRYTGLELQKMIGESRPLTALQDLEGFNAKATPICCLSVPLIRRIRLMFSFGRRSVVAV